MRFQHLCKSPKYETLILAFILAAALAICITGCDKDKAKADNSSDVAEGSDYTDEDADTYEDTDDQDTSDTPDVDYEMDNTTTLMSVKVRKTHTVIIRSRSSPSLQ